MKNKLIIVITLIIAISTGLIAQVDNLELGKRYIKLGGSFRESGEFNLSKDYLDRGLAIVKKFNNSYWTAVGNEYLGYYWRDRAVIESNESYFGTALKHLNVALNIFKNVIKNDPSSVNAVQMAIAGIRGERPGINQNSDNGENDNESEDVDDLIKRGIDCLYNHDMNGARDAFSKALEEEPDNELAKSLLDLCDDVEPQASAGIPNGKIRVIATELELNEVKKKNVQMVDFSNLGLTNVPDEVFECRNLKVLNFANNELTSISEDDICRLKNLQILDLTNNNLTELPECIKRMKKLQVLYIRGNDIPFSQILRFKDQLPQLQIIMDEEE
jgi:tetratricopeptide (TPR) repeat protein